MATDEAQSSTGWVRLLVLFTAAGVVEAAFYKPAWRLHPALPAPSGYRSGRRAALGWRTGSHHRRRRHSLSPLWGALADRYARQPVIVALFLRRDVRRLADAASGNIWVFVFARCLTSLALGNTGLMMDHAFRTGRRASASASPLRS